MERELIRDLCCGFPFFFLDSIAGVYKDGRGEVYGS